MITQSVTKDVATLIRDTDLQVTYGDISTVDRVQDGKLLERFHVPAGRELVMEPPLGWDLQDWTIFIEPKGKTAVVTVVDSVPRRP